MTRQKNAAPKIGVKEKDVKRQEESKNKKLAMINAQYPGVLVSAVPKKEGILKNQTSAVLLLVFCSSFLF
jgi:hypothetical protein